MLLKKTLKKTISNSKTMLFANIDQESFQLIIFKNKKLLYYNNFEYQTKEDILYFLLFAIEQNKEIKSETKLNLTGFFSEKDKIFSYLSKFIKNIIIDQSTTTFINKNLVKSEIDFILS